ncbi:hypothetical protein ETAE_2106 [Edwardsiella piscicida]|uniref:Uncharacterized protein n=1 Tax=Edwardsiella piscicida TaxID=1263550 RepID=A0AAU8P815_EDWPI|nr:hypothetical protein ETAE_2106 [Edwardsiella tarda EIB202]
MENNEIYHSPAQIKIRGDKIYNRLILNHLNQFPTEERTRRAITLIIY